jgi:hypothetical protein
MCRKASFGSFPVALLTIAVLFSLASALLMPVYASQTLYGCTSNGGGASSLYTIDASTGVATLIGSMGIYGCSGLVFNSAGTLYAVGQHSSGGTEGLFTVNPGTGAATLVGSVARGSTCGTHSQPNEISDLDFNSAGTLYILFAQPPHCLATVNPSTATETDIGHTGISGQGNALGISSSNILYHTSGDLGSSTDDLYTLNSGTGTATFVVGLSGFPASCVTNKFGAVGALKFNSAGTLYGALNCGQGGSGPNYLVTIDTTTGALTVIGQTVTSLDGIAWTPSTAAIPEYPLGLPLLVIFMVIAYGLIKRRTRNPQSL